MSAFKFTEKVEGSNLHLEFSGSIDEDTDFPATEPGRYSNVIVDLQGVKSINSVGIREWLDWIRPLSEKSAVTFINAPKAIVFQINMVEGFLPPNAKVQSMYVPFFCEKCDAEENILFSVGKEVTIADGAIKLNFDVKSACECGGMEMDVTEGKYFGFLKRA